MGLSFYQFNSIKHGVLYLHTERLTNDRPFHSAHLLILNFCANKICEHRKLFYVKLALGHLNLIDCKDGPYNIQDENIRITCYKMLKTYTLGTHRKIYYT